MEYIGKESDFDAGNWFDVVLEKTQLINNYLYFLAELPILDALFRLKLDKKIECSMFLYIPYKISKFTHKNWPSHRKRVNSLRA